MKRKLMLVATMAIVLSLFTLGTLAFFTDSDEATNVMTAGNLSILLHDEDGEGDPFPSGGVNGVMPGNNVDKVVHVENTGDHAAYIRVRLDKSIEAAEGVDATLNFNNITLNINTADWELKDGWYYYKHALAAGATTTDLFTMVSYGTALGNDYQNARVEIDVLAQAVQVANNTASSLTAGGWPNP